MTGPWRRWQSLLDCGRHLCEVAPQDGSLSGRADIVHCHDWATAPVAFGDLAQAAPVFTIHNLNYGADLIGRAVAAAAVATTVSPTYATEVRTEP